MTPFTVAMSNRYELVSHSVHNKRCPAHSAVLFSTRYIINPRQRLVSHQVLFQFGHHLLEDAVVVLLETHQLREAGDEKP